MSSPCATGESSWSLPINPFWVLHPGKQLCENNLLWIGHDSTTVRFWGSGSSRAEPGPPSAGFCAIPSEARSDRRLIALSGGSKMVKKFNSNPYIFNWNLFIFNENPFISIKILPFIDTSSNTQPAEFNNWQRCWCCNLFDSAACIPKQLIAFSLTFLYHVDLSIRIITVPQLRSTVVRTGHFGKRVTVSHVTRGRKIQIFDAKTGISIMRPGIPIFRVDGLTSMTTTWRSQARHVVPAGAVECHRLSAPPLL